MPKTIIFCADGTWNGPGQPDVDTAAKTTNVFKLFLNLTGRDCTASTLLAKEQERVQQDDAGNVMQIAKYLHGVGDSDNPLVKLLGGGLGAGLITRIVRGYTFVSRNHTPGDRIVLTGFSRGAYTARALAGLIAAKGLLDASKLDLADKDAAYRLGAAVWYAYRRASTQSNPSLFGRLEETVLDLPGFLQRPPPDDKLRNANIEAIGVWDTVGALGIPAYNVKLDRVDVFEFANKTLSSVVGKAYHAVAIDEQREDFEPTLWDTDPRVTQVLFPGAHSDVGGGYPITGGESGLSDAALAWMTTRLAAHGVQYDAQPTMQSQPDPAGMSHQPWIGTPMITKPRQFPPGLGLSRMVIDRIAAGPVPVEHSPAPARYAPGNLSAYLTEAGLASAGVTVV